ncbi:MAG: carboxypeptidase regulatory-like domain-containing protein [Chitinophagaceae bacterium]|nr:carboxypeptidase regulatory-like domain-containing protein [Chitinophagaceae bacterium]
MKIFTTILILFVSNIIVAQTASLFGKIIDSRKAEPVPFAAITINHQAQKGLSGWGSKTTNADDKGWFRIDSLKEGDYSIIITAVGYLAKTYPVITFKKDTVILLEADLYVPCKYDDKKNDPTCPKCHKKNKVVPIVYGLPVGELDEDNYYYAGCEISLCDPNWYCKRDKTKF